MLRRILQLALFLVFVNFTFIHVVFAEKGSNLGPGSTEMDELRGLLRELGTDNTGLVLSALGFAHEFPCMEIEQRIFELTEQEIGKGSEGLNPEIIRAAIDALGRISTATQVQKMKELQIRISSLPVIGKVTVEWQNFLLAQIQGAIGIMQTRLEPLKPVMALVTVPVKQDGLILRGGVKILIRKGLEYPFLSDSLWQIESAAVTKVEAADAKNIRILTKNFLTDDISEDLGDNKELQLIGRDQEVDHAISTLLRSKNAVPVFVGPKGSGKTTFGRIMARKLFLDLPPGKLYDDLRGAAVVDVDASALAHPAMPNTILFLRAIRNMEFKLQRPIVVFIDNMDRLGSVEVEQIRQFVDGSGANVKIFGVANDTVDFKKNVASASIFQINKFVDLTTEETFQALKSSWQSVIEQQYGVEFSDDAIREVIANASTAEPNGTRFESCINILQDLAIFQARQRTGDEVLPIGRSEVGVYMQSKFGYPVDPQNGKAFFEYGETLKAQLNQDVLFQPNMIDSAVNLWLDLMTDQKRKVRVLNLLGPTGTGKSELGRSLAKRVFNNEKSYLEIDGTAYQDEHNIWTLFGAANGYKSADQTKGILCDFLDSVNGSMGGIILINEAERMSPKVWERLMEGFDVGEITGGDGKVRKLNRHMFILTSNRGDKVIFPPGVERYTPQEMDAYVKTFDSAKIRDFYKKKFSANDKFSLPDPVIARSDAWALAQPITLSMAKEIGQLIAQSQAREVTRQLGEETVIDKVAVDRIVETYFQYGMGVRPVKKGIETSIQQIVRLARQHTDGKQKQKLQITVDDKGVLQARLVADDDQTVGSASLSLGSKPIEPLDDPEFFKKMNSLLPQMQETIIGQDDVIKSLTTAVIGYRSRPGGSKRPMSLFLVGSTGTGKTETAKAAGQALFDSRDRAEILELGKADPDLVSIFGTPGMTEQPLFEQALARNRATGAVICFDEASNIGTGNLTFKNNLFRKYFLGMLDEGKWTSPVTGETYELGKFVFLFTGNDGESLFQGLTGDDMRMAVYKEFKERGKVQSLLVDHGIPEPFLGRMADVILMKPLLQKEMEQIARNMMSAELKIFAPYNIQFQVDPDFYRMVVRAFFSPQQGARSVRNMLETGFQAALANTVMTSGGLSSLKGKTIQLSLQDNIPNRPYMLRDEKRKVVLNTTVIDNTGKVQSTSASDLTAQSVKVAFSSFEDAQSTALHEAGHAVASFDKLVFLTVIPGGEYLGYARYEELFGRSKKFTRLSLVQRVATSLAGRKAQELAGNPVDAGWRGDLQQIRSLITRSVIEYGLVPELRNILWVDDGHGHGHYKLTEEQEKIATDQVTQIMKEGDTLATQILSSNWQLLRDVAAILLKRGSISGEEFYAMKAKADTAKAAVVQAKAPLKDDYSLVNGLMQRAPRPVAQAGGLRCESILLH